MTKLLGEPAVKNTAAVRMSCLSRLGVILPIADRLRAQDVIKFMTTRVLVCPLSDGIEHLPLNLDTLVPNGWVMESSDDIIDNFVDRHARVLPCV